METNELWELLFPRLTTALSNGLSLQSVATFCRVSLDNVRRWKRDKTKPAGESAIRLMYLLREFGVPSPEIESFNPYARLLGELLSFDVIDAREAQEITGQSGSALSQVYLTMRGSNVMHPKLTIDELDDLYGEELRTRRKQIVGSLVSDSLDRPGDPDPVEQPLPRPAPLPTVKAAELPLTVTYEPDLSLTLASLLGASAPLAKQLNESGTAESRSHFRDLIGAENLFELSNTLNALCSERARGMVG